MISDRELRRMAVGRDATVISEDIACGRCSYNLKGLKNGGNCPECGNPISPSAGGTTRDSSLVSAPRDYLIGLAWAARAMLMTTLAGPPTVLLATEVVSRAIGASISLAWAILWYASAWGISRPRRPGEGDKVDPEEDRVVVTALRVTQFAWILAAAMWTIDALGVAMPAPIALFFLAIGYFGAWSVFLRAATIADAASDPDFARLLRQSLIMLFLSFPWAGTVFLLCWMLAVLFWSRMPLALHAAISTCAIFTPFVYLTWRIAALANWALRISVERDARDARMVQRAKREARKLG